MATRMRVRNNGDNPGLGRPLIPAEPVYPSFLAFCLGFFFLFLHLHSASRCGPNDMQTKKGNRGCRWSAQVWRHMQETPQIQQIYATWPDECLKRLIHSRRGSAGSSQGGGGNTKGDAKYKEQRHEVVPGRVEIAPSNADCVFFPLKG